MAVEEVKTLKMPSLIEGIFFERKKKLEEALQSIDLSLESISELSTSEPTNQSEILPELYRVITFSDFVFDNFCQRPELLKQLLDVGQLHVKREQGFYQKDLQARVAECESPEQWMSVLRKYRRAEMLRFIWREVNGLCDIRESAAEISAFAKAAISVSLDFLHEKQKQLMGTPLSSVDGSEQKLCVLGMGKLGGDELNLSSDIDLIFFYKDTGKTDGARAVENQQFFVRLAQQLIRTLDEKTVDGFVFRVDMRLRPYGDSGLLVLNQNAMELYYETQGRTWERYAFVKAAYVAGDRKVTEALLEELKPFVYRKYVDFSVVESLREMKQMINRQVKVKGLEGDVKIGEGGIRELEFIVQALQLIKGGRKPELQLRSYYGAMDAVNARGLMADEDKNRLCDSYSFFRRLEHFIQGRADQQSQMLPTSTEQREALAWVMNFDSWQALEEEISRNRNFVREIFDDLFATPEEAAGKSGETGFNLEQQVAVWQHIESQDIPFSSQFADQLNEIIRNFSNEKILKNLSENEKRRLDHCMAYLIFRIEDYASPDLLLENGIRFLRVILHRSVYLVLLSENPKVFDYILSLFQRSQWVLDNLLQHPFLLDELLQLQNNKALPSVEEVRDELRQLSLRMDAHDLETRLEELRVFKCTHEMKAAALYLDNFVSTSDLGDFLSALAEALLNEISRIALDETIKGEGADIRKQFIRENFGITAYGKLGSREMGFGSDLDIVFIFDEKGSPFEDTGMLLTRFGQKIIHLLSVRTYSGILYEVDMRLRPNGKSGPLVSNLHAFEKYQQENAWTWEHQALVKARVVVGSEDINRKFDEIRARVLCKERDIRILLQDMIDMQKRLRENSPGAKEADLFHLKSDQGGIVDIEFLAQFLVLSEARNHPDLLRAHATLEVFNFAESVPGLKPEWLPGLKERYFTYRRQINELTLAYQKVMLPRESFEQEREEINSVWQKLADQYLKEN